MPEPAPERTPPDDTTEAERLAKHLAGRHADGMALQRSVAENREAHQDEHDGPGTIRNHDRGDLSYDEQDVQQVIDELAEGGSTPEPDDTTEGLRERVTEVIHATSMCEQGDPAACAGGCRDLADAVLAALAGVPGDLPARMAEAMRRALGSQLDHFPNAPEFLAAAAMSVRWEHAVSQAAEVERLRAELAEPRPTFKAFRLVDGQRMAATQRAEKAEAERDALKAAIERLTAERVRAEHFACRPHRCGDEASGMDGKERCHGCRRAWPCPTIAALDAPETTQMDSTDQQTAQQIDDALWRMHQLRMWAYRETTGEVQHNVLSVITNIWDCLDPDRTRGPALDAPTAEETNDG